MNEQAARDDAVDRLIICVIIIIVLTVVIPVAVWAEFTYVFPY